MIIGITGLSVDREGRKSIAGSGKDTIAEQLVSKHGFVSVALADPMKRFCMEVFGFTDEQLWGPSEKRNEPDSRYLRPSNTDIFLTPRYALQTLGTEWARFLHQDVWVDYALEMARGLLENRYCYDQVKGRVTVGGTNISERRAKGVVIPDLRFRNEFERIKEAGGKVWRVKRTVESLSEQLGEGHLSERELLDTPDEEFDAILPNEGDIHYLHMLTDAVMARESGRIIPYDDAQADVPPFKRG